jgi:nitroreductase
MNRQPWDLIVVTDRGQLEALAGTWQGASHVAHAQAAVAIVAPVAESERQAGFIQFDLGQMTMQLMIAAAGLGIGAAHAAVEDQDLARRILGFPEDRICPYLIALGYPEDGPLHPLTKLNRRPFDEVVHRGRF